MGFDSYIKDFEQNQEKVNTTPAIVTQTLDYGNELIDADYFPKIQKIALIKKYLKAHKDMNLYQRGWRFQFGSSRQWAGLCSSDPKTLGITKDKNIYVSIQFVKHDLNWKDNMRSVILHEIAHAIVMEIFWFDKRSGGYDELHRIDDLHRLTEGHGLVWKAVCKALSNSDCRVKYENANTTEAFKKFKYDCAFCDHTGYGDRPKFAENCSKCEKPVIVQANIN